jgi:hypothetical protein
MPALYPIPGFSTHPDHIRAHTISPHKPASAIYLLFCCQVPPFRAASRCLFARSAPPSFSFQFSAFQLFSLSFPISAFQLFSFSLFLSPPLPAPSVTAPRVLARYPALTPQTPSGTLPIWRSAFNFVPVARVYSKSGSGCLPCYY